MPNKKKYSIDLTVGDHDQNGFVQIATWRADSLEQAKEVIAAIDAQVCDESEPDLKTAPFTFVLDLNEGDYSEMVENGERCLPMQIAMRIAPEQVSQWLKERPVPDEVIHIYPPVLEGLPA